MEFCPHGELYSELAKLGTFSRETARFYAAEILVALEFMHEKGVVHRDLKPENVLIAFDRHVRLIDFGTAFDLGARQKQNEAAEAAGKPPPTPPPSAADDGVEVDPNLPPIPRGPRAHSFVGTAEYMAPEMLAHRSVGYAADLWSFGCFLFQLLAGRVPIRGNNEYLTCESGVCGWCVQCRSPLWHSRRPPPPPSPRRRQSRKFSRATFRFPTALTPRRAI
jgi:3-phosphoinositide dependent protein kinase-1